MHWWNIITLSSVAQFDTAQHTGTIRARIVGSIQFSNYYKWIYLSRWPARFMVVLCWALTTVFFYISLLIMLCGHLLIWPFSTAGSAFYVTAIIEGCHCIQCMWYHKLSIKDRCDISVFIIRVVSIILIAKISIHIFTRMSHSCYMIIP